MNEEDPKRARWHLQFTPTSSYGSEGWGFESLRARKIVTVFSLFRR